MIQLGDVGDDAEAVQLVPLHHVPGVQECRDAKMILSNVESQAAVCEWVIMF